MSEARSKPFSVTAPFDNVGQGDFTLQTSDGAKFRVYRNILSLASSVFEGMLCIPQPAIAGASGPESTPEENSPDRQCVELSEDAKTIDVLLRCIYPIPKPIIQSTGIAAKVTLAADKYFISTSCLGPVYSYLRRAIKKTNVVDAHIIYALAWRLDCKDVALEASQAMLAPGNDSQFASQLPTILETSGDVKAQLALEETRKAQVKGLIQVEALLKYRIGSLLCRTCVGSAVLLLQFDDRIRELLATAISQIWACKKGEIANLGDCIGIVEKRLNVNPNCPRCGSSTNYNQKGYGLPDASTYVDIRVAKQIFWPIDKQDDSD